MRGHSKDNDDDDVIDNEGGGMTAVVATVDGDWNERDEFVAKVVEAVMMKLSMTIIVAMVVTMVAIMMLVIQAAVIMTLNRHANTGR